MTARPDASAPARGHVDLAATVAARGVDLTLSVAAGEVVAVIGANGAGKSTLLALLSGLLRPDTGRITLDDQVLVDTTARVWEPPHRRNVVLLAQQALLFPHLKVVDNVAFGPRSHGAGRRESHASALRWLEAVDAAEFGERTPAQLSGGQAQRVAIARALAADPSLLLLDEPMAALDVSVAPALRRLLRRVLRDTGRTAVLVTHDLIDALSLTSRVIVLDKGRIVEQGPTRDVLAAPRTVFTARLAGINLIAGTRRGDHLITVDGQVISGLFDPTCEAGGPVVAVFQPSAVAVHRDDPAGSPRNHLPVVITEFEPRGDVVRVHATPLGGAGALLADITVTAAADLDLQVGERVTFVVKATEVAIHPAAG